MILESAAAFSLPNILCGVVANGCTKIITATSKNAPIFGKLLRTGTLDANHDLEHLVYESIAKTLQLLNPINAKREEHAPI